MSRLTELAAEPESRMQLPRLDLALLALVGILAVISFATAESRDEIKAAVTHVYWLSGTFLPFFYLPQILSFWRGKRGVGDFDVKADVAQFMLRMPAFLYAFVALNPSAVAPFAFAVGGDLVGRFCRLVAIYICLRREKRIRKTF